MKISVLGPGCTKCRKLHENTVKAVTEAGVEAEVVKVESIEEISRYNVFITPALVIDGAVKSTGKVAKPDQIRRWIEESE